MAPISHLRRVAALIGVDLPPSQPSADLHVLSVLIFENPKAWFLWVLFCLCFVFLIVVHAPFFVSVACALLLFILFYFIFYGACGYLYWCLAKEKAHKNKIKEWKVCGFVFLC